MERVFVGSSRRHPGCGPRAIEEPGEAPNASVLVSQWDTFHRDKSADSGGQFNTTTCKLAAPAEISMSATGVLNVDLKKKRHAMSLVLLSAGLAGDLGIQLHPTADMQGQYGPVVQQWEIKLAP